MARETRYIVQAFSTGSRNSLKADAPFACQSATAARRSAARLAATRIGVVAFASAGDWEAGEYDEEPVVLFKAGRLPEQFDDKTESSPGADDGEEAEPGRLHPATRHPT